MILDWYWYSRLILILNLTLPHLKHLEKEKLIRIFKNVSSFSSVLKKVSRDTKFYINHQFFNYFKFLINSIFIFSNNDYTISCMHQQMATYSDMIEDSYSNCKVLVKRNYKMHRFLCFDTYSTLLKKNIFFVFWPRKTENLF